MPATVVTADWMNAVQEEIAGVIEGAGDTLDKPDNDRLRLGRQPRRGRGLHRRQVLEGRLRLSTCKPENPGTDLDRPGDNRQ